MSPENLLRDLLEREAADAPHVVVPADTWRRGRRRRTLKAGAAVAAAAAVVAGIAVGPGMPGGDDRSLDPAGPTSGLGLPDHLHAPPERMSDQDTETGEWIRDEVRSDLAVGAAAAAWVTPGGLPVVVDAGTGEHYLLDLPDVVSANLEARSFAGADWLPLALSPDGTRLAYGTARFGRDGVITGIRILDLTTGEGQWRRELAGGAGIVVTELSWSPSGTWVGWQGRQTREWTGSSIGGSLPVAGVVGADGSGPVIGVAGGGAVVTADEGVAYIVEPGRVRGARYCRPSGAACVGPSFRWTTFEGSSGLVPGAALSPDGARLALSRDFGYDLATLPLPATAPGFAPPVRLAATIGTEGAPDDRPWSTSTLGWVDDDHVLALRDPNDGSDSTLSIVPVDAEQGSSIDVGTVDAAVGRPSIAIDLVTLDRSTVDRPAPDWPWSEERWVVTVGGGVLLAGLLALAARLLVRRRR